MADPTDWVFEVDGLTVSTRYGGRPIEVLQDVSFKIARGRILGMIGESGAGKSMIGRAILNALPPGFSMPRGGIRLRGTDLHRLSASSLRAMRGREIAFIPQDPQSALNPVISIGAHFDEQLRRLGVPRKKWAEQAEANLRAVEIAEPKLVLGKYPHQLSGGMCQRVLIAMAFAAEPDLIIADEPTTALDALTQARVIHLLRGLQLRLGTAVIFITHDLRLATHVCDHVMVLYAGQPIEYGPAREIFANPRHPYTQSLQAANPKLEGSDLRLPPLPDQMPGFKSFASISGCRFSARGGRAASDVSEELPDPIYVAADHWVRASPATLATPVPQGEARTDLERPRGTLTPLLRADHLVKVYAPRTGLFTKAREVRAVDDVSFSLQPGEFVGIVGLSGSGKSSLARLLVGLEQPDSGVIEIDGENMIGDDFATKQRRTSTIQMIFQNSQSSLNPRRTIGDLVTQGLEGRAAPRTGQARADLARELLRQVGLPADVAGRYPMQLSGGQRQRVGIARALCMRPRIIVADEIVSGLDVSVQAQILNLLLDLREHSSLSLVFITHDLSVVRYLCDRTLVVRHGMVVEEGATADVISKPKHDYTRSLIEAVPPEDPFARWLGPEHSAVA